MSEHQVTVMGAIDELQRTFRKLNDQYFNGELEKPIITIQTDVTSGAYAWITENKVWSGKNKNSYREINMTAEYLSRDYKLVVVSLLHEMVHLKNIMDGKQDTSRAGTYHNKLYKEAAEKVGLLVEKDVKYGYCVTKASETLAEWIRENCRKGCFNYKRAKTYKDGTPKVTTVGAGGKEKTVSKTKQSTRKYECPKCGLIVRSTKDITGKLMCLDCNEVMLES